MSEVSKGIITGKSVPEDISKYCRLTLNDGNDYISKDKDIRVAIEVSEMGDEAEIEYTRRNKKDGSGQFNALDKLTLKGGAVAPASPKSTESSPETGMWYKEIGEMVRAGKFKVDDEGGKALIRAYYEQMKKVILGS